MSCRVVRSCRTRPRAGLLSSDKRLTLRALPVDPSAIHIVVTVAGSSETPTARALADTSVVAFALSASSAARRLCLCLCLPALQQAPVQKGTTVSSPAAGRSTPRKCGADHARIAGHGRVGLRVASARDSGRPLVNVSSRPASAGAGAGEAAGKWELRGRPNRRPAARPRHRCGSPCRRPGRRFPATAPCGPTSSFSSLSALLLYDRRMRIVRARVQLLQSLALAPCWSRRTVQEILSLVIDPRRAVPVPPCCRPLAVGL